jgi:MoxR-like ATPase
MHAVATQLNAIKAELNRSYLERQEAIEASILALVCGQHICLLGPPGTGKTDMITALWQALTGASTFEIGLSKNRPAAAVLGPLDIKEYRETGNYFLRREGYATDVDLLFLDEIGKMSPVLGHDMLALLNERKYHEVSNGRSAHSAPLWTAFTASNELPTNESDDAAALWDRLLFRVVVDYLQEPANFAKLLTSEVAPPTTTVNFEELKLAARTEVPAITITDHALDVLTELRMKFAGEHIYPSDRRWHASIQPLKASAFLAGRTEVLPADVAVLQYTLWDTPEQLETAQRLCLAASNPYAEDLAKVIDGLKEIQKALVDRENDATDRKNAYGREANAKLVKSREELDSLLQMAGAPPRGFRKASDLHRALDEEVARQFLQLPDDVAAVYLERRKGMGDGTDLGAEF